MESVTTVPAFHRTSGEQSGFCATDGEECAVGRLSVVEPSGVDACLSVQAANGRREVRVRRKLERKVGIWWKMFLCVVINVLTYVNQNRNHLAVLDFST